MQPITLYGIPNCDTVKKAMHWLKKNKIGFTFYNFKTESVTKKLLTSWCKKIDWEILLNKKSATWRQLSKIDQEKLVDQQAAINIMLSHTSIIKRPVLLFDNHLLVGFNEAEYALLLAST
jgi:arsenate reductase (glutaredoxin)